MVSTEYNSINILNVLHQDHHNISRLLDIFEKQIDVMQSGEAPDYRLMQDVMHYMGHYPDEFHHPREEKVYVRAKNIRPDIDRMIDRIVNEHAKMAELNEHITDKLTEIFNGSIVPVTIIHELSKEYLDLMRSHIHCEESDLLPMIWETLSEQDWQDIDESESHIDDPLFGKTVEDFYQYLYSCIQEETGKE